MIALVGMQREFAVNARMSTPHRLGGEQVRGDRKRLQALLLQKFAPWSGPRSAARSA